MIYSFCLSNDNVSLKVNENTQMMLVTQVCDLEKHFDIRGLVGDVKG